jgi:hypothetical protein
MEETEGPLSEESLRELLVSYQGGVTRDSVKLRECREFLSGLIEEAMDEDGLVVGFSLRRLVEDLIRLIDPLMENLRAVSDNTSICVVPSDGVEREKFHSPTVPILQYVSRLFSPASAGVIEEDRAKAVMMEVLSGTLPRREDRAKEEIVSSVPCPAIQLAVVVGALFPALEHSSTKFPLIEVICKYLSRLTRSIPGSPVWEYFEQQSILLLGVKMGFIIVHPNLHGIETVAPVCESRADEFAVLYSLEEVETLKKDPLVESVDNEAVVHFVLVVDKTEGYGELLEGSELDVFVVDGLGC